MDYPHPPPLYTQYNVLEIYYTVYKLHPLTAFLVSSAKRNKARKAELVVFTFQFHFFLSFEEETSLAISINTRKGTAFSFERDFMDTFNVQSHHRYIYKLNHSIETFKMGRLVKVFMFQDRPSFSKFVEIVFLILLERDRDLKKPN